MSDGLKAVRVSGRQLILDLDLAAHLNQFLKALLVFFGQIPILPLLQELFNLCVNGIKGSDICSDAIGNISVSGSICSFLEGFKLCASSGSHRFEGICPLRHNGVRFLFTVRPYPHDTFEPRLHITGLAFEIRGGHAEERKTVAISIEGISCSALPFFSGFIHTLQGFSGHFGTRSVVNDRNGGSNDSRCNG